MKLFGFIKQKREEKALIKAKEIEAEKLRQEQIKQQELEARKKYIQNLLNSPIEQDYIVRLHRYIRDNYDHILYGEYEYFLCPIRLLDFGYGDQTTVIKITGNNLGDKYTMYGHGYSIRSVELWDRNGMYWEGKTTDKLYIPSTCTTIRELNEYATSENIKRKQEYEEKAQKTNQVREMFFK